MEAPKIPSFIKTKHQFKRFSFQPRFYDAEKESLKIRKKEIENEIKGNKDSSSQDLIERKERMRRNMENNWQNRRGENRKSNLRIALIVVILVIILYVVKQILGI